MTDPADTNAYDRVPYVGGAFAQTHPIRLATVASLFGLDAPPPGRCRVLELGCGNGSNLIPMADSLPGAEFVGVDLAASPVEQGNRRIARLGIPNVRLEQGDVCALDRSLGRFDYVIAHGLYSWIPPAVRPHVMRVFGELLTDDGVAYVSYNALPGCRLRHLVRDLLKAHFGSRAFEPSQIGEVRAFLADLARLSASKDLPFLELLQREIAFVGRLPDDVLFHDDLAVESHAFLLTEVVAEAASNGLQFLGEAALAEMFTPAGFHAFDHLLETWSGGDRVSREQHFDYVRGRRFRQTLLCRAERTLRHSPGPDQLRMMHLRSRLTPEDGATLHDRQVARFGGEDRGAQVDEPIVKVALVHLAQAYPATIGFEPLLRASLAECTAHGAVYEQEPAAHALAALCWSMVRVDLVEPFRDPLLPPPAPGERPLLRPLLADALRHDILLTTPVNGAFQLEDATARRIALAMDGERDLAALVTLAQTLDPRGADAVESRLQGLIGYLRANGAFAA